MAIPADVAEAMGREIGVAQRETGVPVDLAGAIEIAETDTGRSLSAHERRYVAMGYEVALGR